jgi:hypothetical protein
VDWTSSNLGQGLVADTCGLSNETLGSIKDREFLGELNDYWFLKKDSAA